MKQFSIIKIGYTAGIYGCSGEYFTCITVNGKGTNSFIFEGLYGAESRVAEILKERGYTEKWVNSLYGKLTRKDIPKKAVISEYEAVDLAKTL